ncbi:MAG: hypothetical protein SFV24_11000 [Gemmatimonadales bacterium]|nr:hypothetical protein [Gemmatimonadales bacterium]
MSLPMSKDFPDHHDADLILRSYELRREPVLRDARKTITIDWWPKSADDLKAVGNWDHPQNSAFRQVTSYWELVYGMARHGVVHPEYLVDASGGEAFIILAKVYPWLAEFRQVAGPRFLRNTEWAATETTTGRELFARLRERVDQLRASR